MKGDARSKYATPSASFQVNDVQRKCSTIECLRCAVCAAVRKFVVILPAGLGSPYAFVVVVFKP